MSQAKKEPQPVLTVLSSIVRARFDQNDLLETGGPCFDAKPRCDVMLQERKGEGSC